MTKEIENPFNYRNEPELSRIFDNLLSLRVRVADNFAKAEKIAGLSEVNSFVPLKNIDHMDLPDFRLEFSRSMSYKPIELIEARVREAIKNSRAKIAEVDEYNKQLEEKNQKLISHIRELMTRLGVAASYTTSDYPTSRSKTKKAITHTAGYITDLERVRPKSNVSSMKYSLDNYERAFESWIKAAKEDEARKNAEKDEAAVRQNILGNPVLVATLMQAGVNIIEEVQKALPGKKSEVVQYCKALAISNLKGMANPDTVLMEKITNL